MGHFEDIFSYSVGCLFILFMVSFAVQMYLSLIVSSLFIFGFITIYCFMSVNKSVLFMFIYLFMIFIFLQDFYSIWSYI